MSPKVAVLEAVEALGGGPLEEALMSLSILKGSQGTLVSASSWDEWFLSASPQAHTMCQANRDWNLQNLVSKETSSLCQLFISSVSL